MVTATTSERVDGRWRRTGTHFWNTVTGPRAVCRLDFSQRWISPTGRLGDTILVNSTHHPYFEARQDA